MDLEKGKHYKVVPNQRFHASRIGYFEFLGGPDRNVVVLSDLHDPHALFAVGLNEIVGFDPNADKVFER